MSPSIQRQLGQGEVTFIRPNGDTLHLRLAGAWKLGNALPSASEVEKQIASGPPVRRITFDTQGLREWDTGLLTFLVKVLDQCAQGNIPTDLEGLPPGVQRLLRLARAVPERKEASRKAVREPFLARIGASALRWGQSATEVVEFVGEMALAIFRLFRGKARFQRSDLFLIMQDCGAQALPIVSLISLLVGLILAFIGAVQLQTFGAQIYVADLVGIAMVRVMGAVMTGIIVAGRTGAAFAAELGTMQVNEEIDALKTLGIPAMEFLVLPRMLALVLMMPLLCLYADLMGVLGGMIVGVGMLDLSPVAYFHQTCQAVSLTFVWIGLFHGAVFGVLVALSGCLRGIQCGRSASAVGAAATSAVVTGIISIVVATAIITVICNVIGI